ncbi:MAG: energy-coupling factor ABC transporter substrate-binding protein [Desulfotomaculales bacterium]
MGRNVLLLLLVGVLVVLPFVVRPGAEFAGADGQAEEVVAELRPDYRPWVQPLWEPPSSEVESLLFALQAALGSAFVFYYLGYVKGLQQGRRSVSRDALPRSGQTD